jgi:hypothetical protein
MILRCNWITLKVHIKVDIENLLSFDRERAELSAFVLAVRTNWKYAPQFYRLLIEPLIYSKFSILII